MAVQPQTHIHLSTAIGSAPENAPTLEWTVRDREEVLVFRAEISESLTGNVYAHVIKHLGEPVVRSDFNYEIKIIGDNSHNTFYYVNLLKTLAGKEVYLVDNYHPDDGEDHSAYVTSAFVLQLGPFPANHMALAFFYVPIQLTSLEQP